MTLFGWDASLYDHARGPMDMARVKADGISFFTHRATIGVVTKDVCGPSLLAARNAGIPFLGAYLGVRSVPSASAQVDYFLSWVNAQAGWWPMFPGWFWQVDTEKWATDQVPIAAGHAVASLLEARTGRRVLHYAPEWCYGSTVPAGPPLWASSYVAGAGWYRTLYPGDDSPRWHAYSGRAPAVLQYSSSGVIAGQGPCDCNAFRGEVADFARLITIGGAMATWVTGQPWRVVRGLDTLRDQLRGLAPLSIPPATDVNAWGAIADDVHSQTSDHYPHFYPVLGATAAVCARDFPHAPALGLDGDAITEHMRQARDPRVGFIIFDRRITGPSHGWVWDPYTGDDPHDTHFHVSSVHTAAADGVQPWSLPGVPTVTPNPSPEEEQMIVTITPAPPAGTVDVRGTPVGNLARGTCTPNGFFGFTGGNIAGFTGDFWGNTPKFSWAESQALCNALRPPVSPVDVDEQAIAAAVVTAINDDPSTPVTAEDLADAVPVIAEAVRAKLAGALAA